MTDPVSMENKISDASPPWTAKDVVWGIFFAFIVVILFAIGAEVSERRGLAIGPGLLINLGTLLLLVPVWYFTIYKYKAQWADLGLRAFNPSFATLGCGLMIIFFIFNAVYGAILALFDLQIQPDIFPLFDSGVSAVGLFIGGAIVAPIVEEIFFRGFIFTGLKTRWNWKVAMLISAFLFALVHVVPTSYLPIFILGSLFAYLYQLSGSIWPGILMHMLTNTMALSVAYAIYQGWIPAP